MCAALGMSACVSAEGALRASTVEAVISPTAMVLRGPDGLHLQTVPGEPVLYCGLEKFLVWASTNLVSRPVVDRDPSDSTGLSGPHLMQLGKTESLRAVLARDGWLRPPILDDIAQAAISERRGGWSCAPKTAPFAEMGGRVDPKILASIAMNESAYRGKPWPWTLNVARRGFFFATRDDAHAAIAQLLGAGRCDFDVGLMQINWCYHKGRFASAWDALSPMKNIQVAESLLSENLRRSGSPMRAVAWYHSADPSRGRPYLARFMAHLKQLEGGS